MTTGGAPRPASRSLAFIHCHERRSPTCPCYRRRATRWLPAAIDITDSLVREVDLSDDLWGPIAEPLQDPPNFHQVRVDPEAGTVVWPNGYDLDPEYSMAIMRWSVGLMHRHRVQ